MTNSRFALWIAVILSVCFTIRLVFALTWPQGGGDWDIYSTVAENILRGCGVSLSRLDAATCIPHFGGNHFPGFPAFVALTWASFAHSDAAIRVVQTLLYTLAVWRLIVAVREFSGSEWTALLAGLVFAISPLQIAWPRYTQTETLSLAVVTWVFAEILASFAQRKLRAVPLGIAIAAGVFIRSDAILLSVPVAVAAFILHPPMEALRRGVVAAVIVVLPIAAWTARNIAVGLPSLFPAPMVIPDNAPAPIGYLTWGATWITKEYQRGGWAWPVTRMKHEGIVIDPAAYDSEAERKRVEAWLDELKSFQDKPFPKHIDDRFMALARERAARDPVRVFLTIPAQRMLALWSNPFSSFGWPNEMPSVGYQERVEAAQGGGLWALAVAHPIRAGTKAFTGAYRFAIIGTFLLLLGVSLTARLGKERAILLIAPAFIIARTMFFAFTNNVETRYMVQTVPALELCVVLGLSALYRSRVRARAA